MSHWIGNPPSPQSPLLSFDIDIWDAETFQALPEWIQNRIKKSTQYQKLHVPEDPLEIQPAQQQGEGNPI